jgi:DNA-binding CsgD family transcriptional regulator
MAETPFVGRAPELAILHAAFREVERAETAAVFVVGESGVGKTRLLSAASEEMLAAGAVVLSGACLDIGEASPLHPLRQALRHMVPEPEGTRSAAASAVRELMAVLDGEATSPDGAGALLERLSRGLGAVADGRTLVLIVDDLQWADRTTRQLLLYLLAGLGGIRLLLLGATRAETLQGADPLRLMLVELRRLRSVRVLELSPLAQSDTERLATAIAGRSLDPAAVHLVWERSAGHPFFVEELARDARDGRVGPSDTLRESLLARVDTLPPPARTVVTALAAGVEPVDDALLAQVVQLAEEPLIEATRLAVDQRILVAGEDGYRFHHRLIKEVLEPRLLPGERVRLHRRYADALATRSSGQLQNARLAHHWRLAGERARALAAATAAAEEAEQLHGFAEAFEHWTDALELATELRGAGSADVDVTVLRQRAAEAGHRCGEHERALALLEQLGADGASQSSCWLYIRRARYLAAVGRLSEAEIEYERALAGDGCTAPDRATAAAHSAELLLRLGRYADAGKRAYEALDLAHGIEDSASSLVLAGAVLGFSQAYLDDPAAGVATVREALATAERLGGPVDVARAYLQLADLLTGPLNELEDGIAVASRGAEYAEQVGLGRTYGSCLLAVVANGLFRLGSWTEAENVIAAAFQYRPSGADAVELLLARCRIRVGYGDLDAAERDLEAIDTLLAAGGGARYVLPLLTLRAGLAMWRGRPAMARDAVRQGLDLAESRSDDVWLQAPLVWHGLRAEAEARSSGADEPDEEAVSRLREVVERIARDSADAAGPVRDAVTGYQELCFAEIGRVEGRSDPTAWARAAEVWKRRHHPYPAAYARLRQAEALFAQRTRNAEAAMALREAYHTARHLGAHPFTAEIQALADRARVLLDGTDAAGADPVPDARPAEVRPTEHRRQANELALLTKRELQVLARVAAGDTNREIADNLYISERTVGVHVSHILDKLQVRSRVQASAVYQRSLRPGG